MDGECGSWSNCPRARHWVNGGRKEFASPSSCLFLVAGLAVALCDVLWKGWKQSSSCQRSAQSLFPQYFCSGPWASPTGTSVLPRGTAMGCQAWGSFPSWLELELGKSCKVRSQAVWTAPQAAFQETQYLILWEDLAYAGKPVTWISDSKSMGPSSLGERDQPACTPWHFCDIFQATHLGTE